jgi:translation elongation factor EF-Tu-like GTPase
MEHGITRQFTCTGVTSAPPVRIARISRHGSGEDSKQVVLEVDAVNGPMKPFLDGAVRPKESSVELIVVNLKNTSKLDSVELIQLIKLEVNEILAKQRLHR